MKTIYNLGGLSCASCAKTAEDVLNKNQYIDRATVNFSTRTAVVYWKEEKEGEAIAKELKSYGYLLEERLQRSSFSQEKDFLDREQIMRKKQAIVAAILCIVLFLIKFTLSSFLWSSYLEFILSIGGLLYCGKPFFIKGGKLLFKGKSNMDTLVSLSAITAFIYSSLYTFLPSLAKSYGITSSIYPSLAMLLSFILCGKYLEEAAKYNSQKAIESLLDLGTDTAQLYVNETEKEIPVELIKERDLLCIRPGNRIPADGLIVEGSAEVDESILTGEFKPQTKKVGEEVLAGSINQLGSFTMQVSRVGEESLLGQMKLLIQEAQENKPEQLQFIDRVIQYFVPVIILIAGLSAFYWSLSLGEPNAIHPVNALLSVLLIACPCALGLAVPMAIVVTVEQVSKRGVLLRDVTAWEDAADADVVIFDKTGTLTEGKPKIKGVHWQFLLVFQARALEKVILALENKSEHPIARSFVEAFKAQGMEAEHEVKDFKSMPGLGIQGMVNDKQYYLGNYNLVKTKELALSGDVVEKIKEFKEKAYTLVYFCNDLTVLAVLAFEDQVRNSAKRTVTQLTKNKEVYLLSGDNEEAVSYVARQVGISNYQAAQSAEDKLVFIQSIQQKGKKVVMIGDGVNDAPGLKQANLGIAVNNAADLSIESADLILRHNNLEDIPGLFTLAQSFKSVVRRNIFWALGYNIILIPLAAGVLYPSLGVHIPPVLSALFMSLSSLTIVYHSLTLRTKASSFFTLQN